MSRTLHVVLVAAGVALLLALVRAIGVESLASGLRGFAPAFIGVVAFELLLDACNTLGWRSILTPGKSAVGFWKLYWIRQAGTAVNQLTPSATLGGEIVKAMLLRPYVGGADATASVVAAKLSFVTAQMMLVLFGLAAVLPRLEGAPALRAALLLGCAASCVGVAGFFLMQRHGMFGAAVDLLTRVGIRAQSLRRWREHGVSLDARLAQLHHERSGAFVVSIAWHFAAQLVGTGQLFYILRALGTPASLTTCLAIEAFALLLDTAVFFVPGRVGVQEGGRVLVFTALGLSAASGLEVALIVRLNQLTVTAIGLVAFGYFSLARTPLTGSLTDG